MKHLVIKRGVVINPDQMRQRTQETRAQIIAGLITTFDGLFNNTTDDPLAPEEVAIAIGVNVADIERWRKNPYLLDMDAGLLFSAFLGMWPEVVLDLALNQYDQEKNKLKEKHKELYMRELEALQKAYTAAQST